MRSSGSGSPRASALRAGAGGRSRRSLVAAALVTMSAAGVFAYGEQTKPLDRTLSCPVPEQGGVNVLHLTAHVKAPPMPYRHEAGPSPAIALIVRESQPGRSSSTPA